jgi:hypothetical protein
VAAFTTKVEPVGIQKVEVAEQEVQENGKREIPEHLTNLFEKSKGELNEQEQTQLSELLCEFEDVFAKSEFLEYHTFPAKVSRHPSTKGNGNTSLVVRALKAR